MMGKQLKLGAGLFGIGSSRGAWRHPLVNRGDNVSLAHFKKQALAVEQAKFDFIFFADSLHISENSVPYTLNRLEPITLLSSLAAVTSHIGLVGTVSTSFTEPFNAARQIASLDQLSEGRAGWNVVTTGLEEAALNFSLSAHYDHHERYQRAAEHLNVVRSLWDSWEDDAFVADKVTGEFFTKSKLHTLNHQGHYFSVKGPLNIARSRQGHPVIFQAGGSDTGKDFAASSADAIFTLPETLEEAVDFAKDIRRRAVKYGRSPDDILIFPGIRTVTGDTEEAAIAAYTEAVGNPDIHTALAYLKFMFPSVDFSKYDLDKRFPDLTDSDTNGYKSLSEKIRQVAKKERLTLRETAYRFGVPAQTFVGSASKVADTLENWFSLGAGDGFIVSSPHPLGLYDFSNLVVPLLQQKGIYRTDYEHATLRENLGLTIPANRYQTKS